MKTLSLLRHAKSSWGGAALDDFERPLSARGEKAARALGRELVRLGLGFECVIASPAARVVGTIAGLAEGGLALDAGYDRRVYLAAPRTLLAIVNAAPDDAESLLIVGHNPGMEQLALLLSRPDPLRDRVAAKYPTGALAEIRFAARRWGEIGEGTGTLVRFLLPRALGED